MFGLVLLACETPQAPIDVEPDTYRNPVLTPVFADPTIIRAEDGYFYAYATEDFFTHETGVRYVAIFRSANLVDWEDMGDAFTSKPSWKPGNSYIWAPDIQYFNGQYYLYYSLSVWHDPNPAIGVAVSDTPTGPFEDQGMLFDSASIGVPNSIDPFVYHDEENDEKWMFWGSWHGIWAIRLSADGLRVEGDKFQVAGGLFEAAYVIHREGYYYLFVSTGHCCDGENSTYELKVGRSTGLLGPYVNRMGQSLLQHDGALVVGDGSRYIGNGHNAVISDDAGDDWLIYHGIDRLNPRLPNGATRRPMMLDKIIWTADGWPQLVNFRPSEQPVQVPYIKED
ncbi:MAG: arabinan endo-1,5-alpha-L-arabinosidase [Acholeplasmatales bacterium]|nr:MAG: arabinan endo-1,5-alpha-L-arabinosidase [Acholeplasmatales bacterium]